MGVFFLIVMFCVAPILLTVLLSIVRKVSCQ